MRNNENNTTFNVRNITLYLENITSFPRILKHHLTDKAKIITLCLVIIMLSFVNIINVSALNYSSNIGVGFTFNPSLSISLSSSDLVIDNLVPGATADSNSINISVTTNIAYGYTLSVNTSSENLVHNNSNNTFSSMATNSDLSNLTLDNTWGYSTSLDSNSWSNYNGLSSSSSTTLLEKDSSASSSIDFKIAAKAGSTQPSGEYTNVINFTVVSNTIPTTMLDAFIASGAEMYNGYFKMQDMTPTICRSIDTDGEKGIQLIDVRDDKLYWVAKLKDDNCWMTQNLDLDLSSSVALTSDDTDISTDTSLYVQSSSTGPYALDSGYTINTVNDRIVVSWTPERSTYTSTSAPGSTNWAGNTGDNSTSGYYHPYSWNRINSNGSPVYPDGTVTKAVAGNHAQSGNYYNWSATVASNDSLKASGNQENSICPKGWRLPINDEYRTIYNVYKTTEHNYNAFGLMASPLWFIRSGRVYNNGNIDASNSYGFYWSSAADSSIYSDVLFFSNSNVRTGVDDRFVGSSVRCMAHQD